MLVLTRESGQTLHLGNDIEIKIVSVAGGKVRIGISAPRDVNIRRGELPPEKGREPETGGMTAGAAAEAGGANAGTSKAAGDAATEAGPT